MATLRDNNEDDSFIILGTSPGTSMDLRCNGMQNGDILDKAQMEDALKDLPAEASMAFKAHFHLGDNQPSPASMMVASTIVTDDRSTEELQKRFGELLDENVILKETLKQNNDSMKEQLQLIVSCQDDMLNTHRIHKEKFDETRELVERLRQENKQLKLDAVRLAEGVAKAGRDDVSGLSGASSGVEFVTSPDDDTIDKLTAQLELVEKQRRQLIVDNEKLTWQKESLEHIVDATSKERDEVKEKLKKLELQYTTLETDQAREAKELHFIIQNLQSQLKSASEKPASPEDVAESKDRIAALQSELKSAHIKILHLENIKLEYTQHKSAVSETLKVYKEQIQDLNSRLKEAQTIMFQPVSASQGVSQVSRSSGGAANVEVYDRTLKHLADLLNALTAGLSDSLAQTLGTVGSLCELKMAGGSSGSVDRVRGGMREVQKQLERQHTDALNNIGKVRGMVAIFEGVFKDYQEAVAAPHSVAEESGVAALSAALLARGAELQRLRAELQRVQQLQGDSELLQAQLQVYKSDFEAEREARAQMASEKEEAKAQLRVAEERVQQLTRQLEEVRKLNPNIHRSATATKPNQPPPTTSSPLRTTATGNVVKKRKSESLPPEVEAPSPLFLCPVCDKPFKTLVLLQQHVYTCPKCMRFSSDQYKVMEDHFDFCLDDF